jgi:hypothetical protein
MPPDIAAMDLDYAVIACSFARGAKAGKRQAKHFIRDRRMVTPATQATKPGHAAQPAVTGP